MEIERKPFRETFLQEATSYAGVLLGTFIVSVGYALFINPYNIVPGGVYGASIVLHNLFPDTQVGTFGYFFDIPLLLLSMWLLGTKLGVKTIISALTLPLMMNAVSWLVYPDAEALRTLDPSLMAGGRLDLTQHLFLAVVAGSLTIGLGAGIIVRSGATSGGTDIVGMLLQKYAHIRFSTAIMLADSAVVLFGLIVFSLTPGEDSLILLLYSLMAIYITSRTVARVLNGSKDDKIVFVISQHELHTLHHFILHDLDRTATLIKSSGLYNGQDKEMLFLVVSYKEVQHIKHVVKLADPKAFVVVTDAYDTYGEGWKTLPNENELQPE